MTAEELARLKARVDADEPNALMEYSKLLRPTDPKEADKYLLLAAQLGQAEAIENVGDMYLNLGKYSDAARCFKIGAKAGRLDCSVKLAVMRLPTEEHAAVRELEELAELNIRSACIALSEYYKAQGNRKQAAYWRSLLK